MHTERIEYAYSCFSLTPHLWLIESEQPHSRNGNIAIAQKSDDEWVVFDAGGSEGFAMLLSGMMYLGSGIDRITDIFLTHAHVDHVGAIHDMRTQGWNGRVWASRKTGEALERADIYETGAYLYNQHVSPVRISDEVVPGTALHFDAIAITPVELPGHTMWGDTAYIVNSLGIFGDFLHGGGGNGPCSIQSDKDLWRTSCLHAFTISFDWGIDGHAPGKVLPYPRRIVERSLKEFGEVDESSFRGLRNWWKRH